MLLLLGCFGIRIRIRNVAPAAFSFEKIEIESSLHRRRFLDLRLFVVDVVVVAGRRVAGRLDYYRYRLL